MQVSTGLHLSLARILVLELLQYLATVLLLFATTKDLYLTHCEELPATPYAFIHLVSEQSFLPETSLALFYRLT